jgi:1-phosphofructokinase family hexose kinase
MRVVGKRRAEVTPSKRIVTISLNPAIDQSVIVPGFAAGEVNRVERDQSDAGGKGVNVASFLADLGLPATVTGFLGHDNAALFEKLFARKDIADHFVRVTGSTRVNIKIIDEAQQRVTDINFPGRAVSAAELDTLRQRIVTLLPTHDWFVLSGSLPAGAPAGFYAELVSLLKRAGKYVVLDTSGEPMRQALAAAPHAIKPNITELEDVLGCRLRDEVDAVAAARELVGRGIELVVISMAARGALFVDARQALLARPPDVKIESTVGAGDAMVAGLVAGRLRGLDLDACARLATATALGPLIQLGPRLPEYRAIEAFMQRVTVRAVTA